MLDFINDRCITNGIDTLMQYACDKLNVYYCLPLIVHAECITKQNMNVDTDIQLDRTSLQVSDKQRIDIEDRYFLSFHTKAHIFDLNIKGHEHDHEHIVKTLKVLSARDFNIIATYEAIDADDLLTLKATLKATITPLQTYLYKIDKTLIIIINATEDQKRDRWLDGPLKENGIYDIESVLFSKGIESVLNPTIVSTIVSTQVPTIVPTQVLDT